MTAIAKIIEWINESNRPIWWRHATRLLIEEQKLLSDHHNLLYRIARKEAGFTEAFDSFEEFSNPVSADGFKLEEMTVTLDSLGPTENISALANDQILKFARSGLTVIYGDNGSGKSSYAKILKNACLTRGEKPQIIGNVFSTGQSRSLAKIAYSEGNTSHPASDWTYKSNEIPALKSIRVFDSKSAFHYLEKEGALDYRPAGLHILDELTTACTIIKENANTKIKELSLPTLMPSIEPQTTAGKFLKSISLNTTSAQLESNAITEQESLDLEILQKDIASLKTHSPEEIKKNLIKQAASIKPLLDTAINATSATSEKAFNTRITLLNTYKVNAAAAELSRNLAFNELPITDIGSETWKELWRAAKTFLLKNDATVNFPPKQGEHCPLCLQEVTAITSQKLDKFDLYIKDKTQQAADIAKANLDANRSEILSSQLDLTPFEILIVEVGEQLINFKQRVNDLRIEFEARKKILLSDLIEEIQEARSTQNTSLTDDLSKYHASIIAQTEQLKDNEQASILLREKQLSAQELTAKKIIKDNRATLGIEIRRLKALAAYKAIKDQTNPRSITQLSADISEKYLTSSLKDNFTNELKSLGFKNYLVTANTRNSNGAQLFKITLTNSTTGVHQIASEGEQKCLALASVLAELRSDNRKSGVIFDDPVNSLDHKWRMKIAKRLMEESLERQVIIFTHEIVFLKFLIESSESIANSKLHILSLDRSLKTTGIVRNSPPWDALTTAKRIIYLTTIHRDLKKIESISEAEYDKLAGSFYGYLREAWERLIEEKLLNKVVERFGRAIHTQRLKALKDISDNDLDKINTAMTKCSALFKGHDAAPGVYESMPSSDEILQDIKVIKDFEQELTTQRKRN
jgi:energy-coupling factor transporter ATP-binding protein EcfA2